MIDLSEERDSIGDLLGFGNAVYDEGNANEVGTSQGSCVRTVPGEAWKCMNTVILDEGQLSVEGPFYDAGPSKLAISGGTGASATARGQMLFERKKLHGTRMDCEKRFSPLAQRKMIGAGGRPTSSPRARDTGSGEHDGCIPIPGQPRSRVLSGGASYPGRRTTRDRVGSSR